jgi:lipoate-protein ligase A
MILIERGENNPYFNIAAEEYVLKNFDEDVLMLWESRDSVVLGKHQNAFAEVNYPYLIEQQIPLVRRISGGGTVFHGKGNLNITVLKNSTSPNSQVDFHAFTKPLMGFLEKLGLKPEFEGKNNITLNGLKISGNSAHVFKNKSLHHGTILFDADINKIQNIINRYQTKFEDKAVKSVVANITNVKPFLDENIKFEVFKAKLNKYLHNYYKINKVHHLSKYEKSEILQLMQSRYKRWEWNFGYSPTFIFRNEISIENNMFSCMMKIKKGMIDELEIKENNESSISLKKLLLGKKFMLLSIKSTLEENGLESDKVKSILNLFHLSNKKSIGQ